MNHKTHIFYTDNLIARATAAIVRLHCQEIGQTAYLYPREVGKARPLVERLNEAIYPQHPQLAIREIAPKHEPADHTVYVIGTSPIGAGADFGRENLLALNTWARGVQYWTPGDLYDRYCRPLPLFAWERLFGRHRVPTAVQLLATYAGGYRDTMTQDERHLWAGEVIPFIVGLTMQGVFTDPFGEQGWEEWEKLLAGVQNKQVQKRITEGAHGARALAGYGKLHLVTDPVRIAEDDDTTFTTALERELNAHPIEGVSEVTVAGPGGEKQVIYRSQEVVDDSSTSTDTVEPAAVGNEGQIEPAEHVDDSSASTDDDVHTDTPTVDMPKAINLPTDMLWFEEREYFVVSAEFRTDVERQGIYEPLQVRKSSADGEPSRYEVLDGRKRLTAARDLEIPAVPCIVVAPEVAQTQEVASC